MQTRSWAIGHRVRVAVATLFLAPALLVACGGDDDGGGEATDEEYMASMCESFDTFTTDLMETMGGAASDPEAAEDAVVESFDTLVSDLEDMDVPSDVREYHDRMTDQMQEALTTIEEDGLEALQELDFGDDVDVPEDINNRLSAAAEDVPECEGVEVF